ncbi:MAG: cytochrome b/b6 domain-containing protein [Candidatus Eremiobacteraeota bacterium]|nr:cytochrome b/b6 domain-containing protein [Candidatus Eremiobacteraeota bacterium]
MRYSSIVQRLVYRYALLTRLAHWFGAIAVAVLISSGLQIFNAAPYLDAADRSAPTRRVLSIDSPADGVGQTTLFGHTFTTTGFLGWGSDGVGGATARAFPGWLTIPAYQDLADGRRWHFFFAWVASLAWLVWLISSAVKGNLAQMVLRPSDLPKLWPMQAYYLRLRREPPPHGTYNPLQKAAYTFVLLVLAPLIVLTGLALSPGIDAIAHPLTVLFGGRQFARLWHFLAMLLFVGFAIVHIVQVATQGFFNHMRSMISGWYRLREHESVGP